MQNIKKLAMDSQSLACSQISFSKSAFTGNGQHYRGITESSSVSFETYSIEHHDDNDSLFVPSKLKTSGNKPLDIKSKSCSIIHGQFSLNRDFPISKPSKSLLQPLNIMVTSMENETKPTPQNIDINIIDIDAPSSLVKTSSSNKFCNELNSYFVENADYIQVMHILSNILANYNDDIDFQMDYKQKRIDGLVFISNHCVHFILYLWQCGSNGQQTQFEFRKTSGDSLASAKFWSEIQALFEKQHRQNMGTQPTEQQNVDDVEDEEKEEVMNFISLDLDLDFMSTGNEDQHLSKSELDDLTEQLIENDLFVVDELNFLYESMMKNKNIGIDILSHKGLMKQLINHSMLNQDVAMSRIVLLILDKLIDIPHHDMFNMDDFELFKNMNVLLNHERQLIKKYTIRLLSRLSDDDEWFICEDLRNRMIENIQKYQKEFANHLSEEILKINQKLMMK